MMYQDGKMGTSRIFKVLVMNITFFSKKQKYEQRAQLILMLILKSIIIQNQFEIDEKKKNRRAILEKLKSFRKKS